jgi:hypothetical protein
MRYYNRCEGREVQPPRDVEGSVRSGVLLVGVAFTMYGWWGPDPTAAAVCLVLGCLLLAFGGPGWSLLGGKPPHEDVLSPPDDGPKPQASYSDRR